MSGWWLGVLITAGCGRLGFGTSHAHDSGGGNVDAPIDTPVGAACSFDSECGRCARCDSTGHCEVEPISDVFLGHRSTCYTGLGLARWCTGYNDEGNLGLGDVTPRATPERANDAGGWTRIFITFYGTTFAEANGQFYSWGNNQLTPVATGASRPLRDVLGDINNPCLWEANGTSSCTGAGLIVWTSLSVGGDHTCGVQGDGSLWCWGVNRSGSLGNAVFTEEQNVPGPSRVGLENDWSVAVAAGKGIATSNGGNGVSCGKKVDGRILCWGHPRLTGTNNVDVGSTPTPVNEDTDWTFLVAHWEHICAGKTDGSVWCWGFDTYNGYVVPGSDRALVPTKIGSTWDAWRLGGHHACGLTGGRWKCFGLNMEGQLGIGTTSDNGGQLVGLCP
jgi:alpha-tubulin suppressor-like RCC1 family protein